MADAFHFADGTSVQNQQELLRVLEQKDEGLTQPHVTRKDYANWVRHALGDEALADRIQRCRSVRQVIDILRLEQVPKRSKESPSLTKKVVSSQEEDKPAVKKAPTPLDEAAEQEAALQESESARKPIHDLRKPSIASKQEGSAGSASDKQQSKAAPRVPDPLPEQTLAERYNAREFLMGFIAGVVITVIIYGIVGTVS